MASWSPDEQAGDRTLNVWVRSLLLVLAAIALLWWLASPAYARAYVNDCPPADAACLALAERLEYLDALLVDANSTLGYIDESTFQTAENTAGGGGGEPSEITGTVALAEGDATRLDLIWIGVFLMGGIAFGTAAASILKREQSKWGMTP